MTGPAMLVLGIVIGAAVATGVISAIAPAIVHETTRRAFEEMRRQLRESGR